MDRLAAGHLDTEIAHQERADEVGSMACRAGHFPRRRHRQGGHGGRQAARRGGGCRSSQRRRRRASPQRGRAHRADAVQAGVVHALGQGLEHLSAGNLTYRIEEELSPRVCQAERTTLNTAIGKLQDAMRQIATNTESMKAGSNEMQPGGRRSRRPHRAAGFLGRGDGDRAGRADRDRFARPAESARLANQGDGAGQDRGRAVHEHRA